MIASADALIPDAHIRLPGEDRPVTIVQAQGTASGQFWTVVYRDHEGRLGEVTLSLDDLSSVDLVKGQQGLSFTGNAQRFRLGVEATRIQVGFQHDMAALAVSNIVPLPHQLEAVYSDFLNQPRLRFLLADDPGAGKTIMAGLYIKELQLRRAADRVLIVTPANLRPQWQRELSERFDIECVQMDRALFDSSPTQNPWDLHDFIIVSRDFMKAEGILDSFVAAERDWDLAIVDEAHGFTMHVDTKGLINKKSDRYKAAERIAEKAHRLILLTATPHSGKNESLWGLLRLLDPDAYGDRCPKDIELNDQQYRKVPKEEMVDLRGEKLFKPRHPHTIEYELEGPELDLYDAVTEFVSKKLVEIRGETAGRGAGFALTAMQRRLASSVRAIRLTLDRRVRRLEKALEDVPAYLRNHKAFQQSMFPDEEEAGDLDEEELWRLEEKALEQWLPETEEALRLELEESDRLLAMAEETEQAGTERKLNELLGVVNAQGLVDDPSKKLLIFTEHRDTLRYLVEKLEPKFEVAQIHGSLRLGERIEAERYFRERAQIMVATEAAGEGINLQFCHLMVNYDIPWNPNRLEQRMGRIHRIGQTQDVHIFNLVATNTREGYVLATILKKIEKMGETMGDSIFDVVGELLAGYHLADVLESVVAGELSKEDAAAAIGTEMDPEIRQRAEELLTQALATHHIDWQQQRDKEARAEERRLPSGYLSRFFEEAVIFAGGRVEKRLDGTLRVTRSPDNLVARSRLAGATRKIAPAYERLTFDKTVAMRPPTTEDDQGVPVAELCGPGHPLFDALVGHAIEATRDDLAAGAAFEDPGIGQPLLLHFLTGDTIDGNNELVHRSFASAGQNLGGFERNRSFLYDLVPHEGTVQPPGEPIAEPDIAGWARQHIFESRYKDAAGERQEVASIQESFLRRSFVAMLARADMTLDDLEREATEGRQGAEGRLRQAELAKAQLQERRDRRIAETKRGRQVRRGPVRLLGTALVIPTTTEVEPGGSDGKRDDEKAGLSREAIEQVAIRVAWKFEEDRCVDYLKSVEADNIGFDLLAVKDIERRCIEVKGRSGVGMASLSWSEFAKAIELGDDYWLYLVLDCATPSPRLCRVRNPAKTLADHWKPDLNVQYNVSPDAVIAVSEGR
jgi:superfamily II DNA or RNA helicase